VRRGGQAPLVAAGAADGRFIAVSISSARGPAASGPPARAAGGGCRPAVFTDSCRGKNPPAAGKPQRQQPTSKEITMANSIVWADIPVIDLERARKFYGAILQDEVKLVPGMDGIALLPGAMGEVSADLYSGERARPSTDGATVFIDCKGDINGAIQRAVAAGGEVIMPPSDMGEMVGTIAWLKDTEGNRIGLHVPPQK